MPLFLMIQFNWSLSDFSYFGEISRNIKFKTLILGPSSKSAFCVLNRFIVCLRETQYLHAEIK